MCLRYFRDNGINPDTIWTGLCEGDREATSWSMVFFLDYVEYSKRMVMVLGPQEYEKRRMVNSASTPLAMWRKLIKEADLIVLSAKRLEDPRNKEKWRLRFHNHNARFPSSSISVFDVSKVGSRSFCVLTRLMFIPKVALDWPRSRSGPAPHQAHHVHEGESHRRRCSRNPPHLVRTCCRSRN
jgi:hypothetical protein